MTLKVGMKYVMLVFFLFPIQLFALIPEYIFMPHKQSFSWEKCGDLQCSKITVPMDHSKPYGATITIGINKYAAKIQPAKKTVFLHPDGPGLSGLDVLATTGRTVSRIFDDQVDIIAFDDRGVRQSNRVDCLNYEKISDEELSLLKTSYRYERNLDFESVKQIDRAAELNAKLCQNLARPYDSPKRD